MSWTIRACIALTLLVCSQAHAGGLLCIAGLYAGTLATSVDGAREIDEQGDFAFIADRSGGLVIADVRDRELPAVVASLPEVGFALDVTVSGSYVYVGTAGGGMVVVQGRDSWETLEIVGLYNSVADVIDIRIDSRRDLAFLACVDEGIRVLDISEPGFPQELAAIDVGSPIYGVAEFEAQDKEFRLLAPFWGGGLRVYDINDPSKPVDVGGIVNDEPYFGIDVYRHTAAALNRSGSAELYDVSLGATPVLLSEAYFFPTLAYDISIRGDRLLVSDADNGVYQFDVEDPASPELVFTYPIDGRAYGMVRGINEVWVCNDEPGMQVIKLLYEQRTTLSMWDDYTDTPHVVGRDGYLYIATESDLETRRIDAPGQLTDLGRIETGLRVTDSSAMRISGDRLYLGTREGRDVSIIDISEPASPVLLGVSRGQTATTNVLAADGNLVYAASSTLEVRDLTAPAAGVTLSETPLDAGAVDAWLEGDLLYLVLTGDSIGVFDVSNPASPVQIGELDDEGVQYSGIVVEDDLAYCITLSGVVRVIDVSDPSSPSIFGEAGNFGQLHDIALFDQALFVSGNGAGQTMIDVSNVNAPEVLIAANEHGTLASVSIHGRVAYSTSYQKLLAYDLSDCVCPADINGDGRRDFFDVSVFLAAYLSSEELGDWNGDGVWNFFDIAGFISSYNESCV